MGSALLGALLLLLLLLSPEAVRSAPSSMGGRSLAGWDWPAEDAADSPHASNSASEEREQDGDQRTSWEFVPAGSKRALSVLSRFTPFTSLGTRRMGRYPVRARGPAAPRDYISAETRGDFSDRPSGQPLRWGR